MIGSPGVVAWLLISAAPFGQDFGGPDGPGPSLGPSLGLASGPAAGFATAWTDEEFVPVPAEEPDPAEQAYPGVQAGYADPYGREMARSMFADPGPAPREENPFIEEKPGEQPPHLRPVPLPPTGGGPPVPPPLRPRDEAYENGLEPFPAPPPETGTERPGVDMTPLEDRLVEPEPPDAGCDTCGEFAESCGRSPCRAPCVAPCGGLRGWLWGIQFHGWINQGATLNTDSPNNRSNFPVGFNDESNAYQLNQVYVALERPVKDCGSCWEFGGRVDLLYGTDHRFTTARGLETHGDFSPKWNSDIYGLAMPQAYAEVYAPVLSGVNVRLGHFYTILGYEVVPAPENFFYSHTYTMLYGEPFTHTGFLSSAKLGEFTVQGGMTRGWDNWEDNNNDLAFLSGVSWTSAEGRTSLAFAMHNGREQDEPPTNTHTRNSFSLVGQHRLNPWWQYVIQYDHGFETLGAQRRTRDAEWYGITQYMFYTLNPCWKFGLRSEWFRDEDGARVHPARIGGADFFAVTAGLNYMPNERAVVRPSFRWAWTTTTGRRPYINFSRHDQITLDMDFIVRF